MAAIFVPYGFRSSLSTASCLEAPPVALSAASLELTALCATAVFPAPGFLAEERLDRSRLAMRLEDFGLDCLVAIWLSLMSATASCAATDTSPASGEARGRARRP